VPYSRLKFTVAKILEREGYTGPVETVRARAGAYQEIKIILKYQSGRTSIIHSVKRISTPGRRFYIGYRDLVSSGAHRGIRILSTPKGVMTDKEARKGKVGGEVFCEVY